jgi:hypothetical protein
MSRCVETSTVRFYIVPADEADSSWFVSIGDEEIKPLQVQLYR